MARATARGEEEEEEEDEEERPIEYETIGHVAHRTQARILSDARDTFTREAPGSIPRDAECYLCAYGHRGIDGLGSVLGMQLHGELLRIISQNLFTSGAMQTTVMAAEFYNTTIRAFFREADIEAPEFNLAQIFVHLSTPLHTKNNRIFYNWALERMATAADTLYNEMREEGKGSNVQKAREARQTLLTMRTFYHDRVDQLSFGAPTPSDIQPEVDAYMSRTELLFHQLPTMSPAALSFVASLGGARTVRQVAAPATPQRHPQVEEMVRGSDESLDQL